MKRTIKKAFTLVELLFVMAIISILAGFAIANLNDSTRIALIASMKQDARTAINIQNQIHLDHNTYATLYGIVSPDANGIVTVTVNGTNYKIPMSKGNKIAMSSQTLGTPPEKVFNVNVYNSEVKGASTGFYAPRAFFNSSYGHLIFAE